MTTTNAESFTLDGASNISARTGPSKTFTIDGSNRPTSDGTNTLTWSSADRLTGRGNDSFGYDPLDRLTSSTVSSASRSYAYNGDGVLQSRTTGGSTVNLLWDPTTSPSRLLVSGSDKIVYGLGPLYSLNGSTATTYARDGQNSIRAELNGSTVTSSWRYRAYGDVVQNSGAGTPSILGFSGQLLDPSGLYYLRARWYDAVNGRFMSRDPLTHDPTASESSNGFAYTSANPVNGSDPSGLCTDPDPGGSGRRYCIDRWIPTERVCTGPFNWVCLGRGDTRVDPQTVPAEDDAYRTQVLVHADGTVDATPGVSVIDFGPVSIPKSGTNSCQSWVGASTVEVTCTAFNGFRGIPGAPDKPIRTSVLIAETDYGTDVSAVGTIYPSLEVWRYTSAGAELLLYFPATGGTSGLSTTRRLNGGLR